MEDQLARIMNWVGRGNLAQFRAEVEGKLTGTEYTVEPVLGALRFFRVSTKGGFLGIGARTVREPVLEITKELGVVQIADEPRDPKFISFLASVLVSH